MKKIFIYLLPTIGCFIVGASASLFQRSALAEWYPLLEKTVLTPPNMVFPIIWCVLYICIGLSLSLILAKPERHRAIAALWGVQLLLNFLWSVLFFYARNPLAGLLDILLLDAAVIAYIGISYPVRRVSAWLFAPYLLWLVLATYMNGYVYFNNPDTVSLKNHTVMTHEMPKLPYAADALAPAMSKETIDYHYGKHLQTYIDNLNKLIAGTPYAEMTLDEIVKSSDGAIFNNAAQTWNHTFFFDTLTPDQKAMPEKLATLLTKEFGSVESFQEQFGKAALGLFGSGWVWLAADKQGKLHIEAMPNAGNPLTKSMKPLLTLDVWEHAYYIDHRNRRADFVKAFWSLVDWDKVAARI